MTVPGAWETLGCVAHRGGMLVVDPVLSVGVVHAVARASGLELQLIARRPVDRRAARQRQADIRDGTAVAPARRVLLPPHDEGMGLRVGWWDEPVGRVRWAHPAAYAGSSGGPAGGEVGPTDVLTYLLPPLFARVELVFAWPEIGLAEQVVPLLLPGRAEVERASVSVWDAPTPLSQEPTWSRRSPASPPTELPRPEEGTTTTDPRVLWRSAGAVVVLTRLSRYERMWQLEVFGHARDTAADIASADAHAARLARGTGDVTARGGLTAGIVDGDTVHWDRHPPGQSTGGPGVYDTTRLCTVPATDTDTDTAETVRVALRWPAVGVPETEIRLRVDGRR